MEIKDALDIMNSDYKLWEQAKTEEIGNGVVSKTIDLPWGIGEYTVQMEGMNDAAKRRDAVGAFGEHIRAVIDERINDEAVTARAKQQAGRAQQVDSGDSDSLSGELGVLDASVQEENAEDTAKAHEETPRGHGNIGETLIARRLEIEADREYFINRRDDAIKELRFLDKEQIAIDAAMEALADE